MAEQGNGRDKALQRLQTLRSIQRLPPKQKLDALIEAPNARELVRAMPAEELYYAIAEVGLADAVDIVHLASPKQFRAFVDLGGWKRDRIDPHQVLTWLRAARAEEREDFLEKFDMLDLEVVEYMLRSFITLHSLEENPDVNPRGVTMETPEGKYLVEFTAEGVELAALRSLLMDLFARNPLETTRMLEATRWEVPSELEETGFRFRSARLEDLGFPPLEQATSLFAYLDPDKVKWSPPGGVAGAAEPTSSALAPTTGFIDYLDRARRGLTEHERENFEQELRAVANAALVAEIQDPGDLDAVRRVGEMVRDYLSLALEFLTQGRPELAVEVVRDLDARKLFQVGFSLTLKLKFRVDRLAKEPLALRGDRWLALSEEARMLSSLRRKRPLKALKVEGADPVPFRSRRELDEAGRVVDRAAAQIQLFRALLGPDEATVRERLAAFNRPPEALELDLVLRGAIAHAVLDRTPRAAPIPEARAGDFLSRLFSGTADAPALREEVVLEAREALAALVEPAQRAQIVSTVNSALETLRLEVAPAWLKEGKLEAQVAELLPIASL